jgi:arylsulfatase A-like enzyme
MAHRLTRRFLTRFALLALPFTSSFAGAQDPPATQASEPRPNIIWLYADDHALQALSAYGGRLANLAPTPNIDRLAQLGTRFDHSYVANSLCAPARATVLTGQHSHKNGVFTNRQDLSGTLDYSQITTFPQILRDAGYHTILIGKWHLQTQPQGFDVWQIFPGHGDYEDPEFRVGTTSGEQRVKDTGKHSTKAIMDRALDALQSAGTQEKPFLLMCHFKSPHRSWLPPADLIERYGKTPFPEPETLHDDYSTRTTAAHEQEMTIRDHLNLKYDLKFHRRESFYQDRRDDFKTQNLQGQALTKWKYQAFLEDYLATVKGIDQQVGRLLDYLEQHDLLENTLIGYSSDQGFFLGEHGWFDKRFMYQESFRTPLIVAWPGVGEPGSVNKNLVQNIDMASTFLDAASLEIPDAMQGTSLLPLIKGQTPENWRQSLYYHYYDFPAVHSVRKHEGVFDGRYKLIRFYGQGVSGGEEWEFYDLENDPHELQSAINHSDSKNHVERLRQELQRLRQYYDLPRKDPS